MKKVIFLVIVVLSVSLSMLADDNLVEVQKSDNAMNVYAKGMGIGKTLEEAKMDAINKILPQLVLKTQKIPGSVQNHMITDGVETGEGIENIVGKALIQGYWKLENEKYIYRIELLLDTSNQ